MFHFLNLCIILIFSILTVTEGQFLDPLNNQQNQIQNNLNNDSQNNVQGYLQNDSKNNNHKEENLEESAKIMINKIEKLVVEYQKLKQNQEDLQKKFTKLEKIVASLNESKAKDNISNVQQKSYENEATKQNKNSNKSTQNNESNLQKNDNFSLDLFNWNESNNLLSNDANLKEKHDYINQFQKSNGISQNYRRSNFPVNPIINNSPNLMTRQAINPNPLNDIFNHQNFAQTQNFIGKGLQQLPYYGRRLYETQIQNPVQYQTYVYSK